MTEPVAPPAVALDLTPLGTASRLRGIGRYVAGLAGGIAALAPSDRRGLDVTGLVRDLPWDDGPWFDPSLRFTGAVRGDPGPVANRFRHLMRRLTRYRRLRGAGPSLFHATAPSGFPPPATLPYVVTCYDLIPIVLAHLYPGPAPFSAAWRERLARQWYGRARRVIAISEATRGDLVARMGVEASRVDVVPCGIDHARFRPAPDPEDAARVRAVLGTDRPFLLYVGGADARKNVRFLVGAFARSGVAPDADLVLAGPMFPREEAALRDAAGACGVAGRVLFPGFVADETLPALYRRCRGHVFASLYEGFGLTVAEALACGAPTATTMNTSLREVAGDAALGMSATDIDAAAAAIRRLAADETLREDLRRRGPPQVAKFTWDACARGVLASYARALGLPSS